MLRPIKTKPTTDIPAPVTRSKTRSIFRNKPTPIKVKSTPTRPGSHHTKVIADTLRKGTSKRHFFGIGTGTKQSK